MSKIGDIHLHTLDQFDSQNDPKAVCKKMKELGAKGFAVTQPPEVAPCIEGRKVTFMQNPFIGIIELLEK